jgi:RNA polymerase sigma-70 factor, ECF subfamily
MIREGALPSLIEELSPGVSEPRDTVALDAIVAAHFPSVWRFLRRLGVPEADADDAAQEVIMIFARKLDRVATGSERAFLLSTAYRVARRMREVRGRRRESGEDCLEHVEDGAPGPELLVERHQERALLDEVLLAMPVDLRAVFVLFEVEEQSMVDIAAVLGLPQGTVASRLRRARADFDARVSRLERKMRRNASNPAGTSPRVQGSP